MRSNPDPQDAFRYLSSKCAIVATDTDRPELTHTLEMKGRMTGV